MRKQEISCIEWRAEMTARRFVSVLELPFVILYSLGSVKVGKGDRVSYLCHGNISASVVCPLCNASGI